MSDDDQRPNEKPAPQREDEAIRHMLAMWVSVALWQIDRLDRATDKYRAAQADGLFREEYERRGGSPEWEQNYRESTATITLAEYWQMGAERYFALHTLAQVRKCVPALVNDNLPHFRDLKMLRLLRDIDEHWERSEGRSLTEVRKTNLDAKPGAMWFNNKHIWIGDVDAGELAVWLAEVDRARQRRLSNSRLVDHEVGYRASVQFRVRSAAAFYRLIVPSFAWSDDVGACAARRFGPRPSGFPLDAADR